MFQVADIENILGIVFIELRSWGRCCDNIDPFFVSRSAAAILNDQSSSRNDAATQRKKTIMFLDLRFESIVVKTK